MTSNGGINILVPQAQNRWHFADNIFKYTILKEKLGISEKNVQHYQATAWIDDLIYWCRWRLTSTCQGADSAEGYWFDQWWQVRQSQWQPVYFKENTSWTMPFLFTYVMRYCHKPLANNITAFKWTWLLLADKRLLKTSRSSCINQDKASDAEVASVRETDKTRTQTEQSV